MPSTQMNRFSLLDALDAYARLPHAQVGSARQIQAFIHAHSNCFLRSCVSGHLTGSALVLNPKGDKILLTKHRKLKRWLQLGGHAEGEEDMRLVTLREAVEESGISEINLIEDAIFDVDIHLIPARPQLGEPAHLHYDIRYLLRAEHENFVCSEESDQLAWVGVSDIEGGFASFGESMRRLFKLWQARPDLLRA